VAYSLHTGMSFSVSQPSWPCLFTLLRRSSFGLHVHVLLGKNHTSPCLCSHSAERLLCCPCAPKIRQNIIVHVHHIHIITVLKYSHSPEHTRLSQSCREVRLQIIAADRTTGLQEKKTRFITHVVQRAKHFRRCTILSTTAQVSRRISFTRSAC
jgi:hypothetical protein